jgi:ribonuclease HI
MKVAKKPQQTQQEPEKFYIDGSGCRPDGSGSGFAWVSSTGQSRVEHKDGLTNNQAEYRALILLLTHLPKNRNALIHTDSQLLCFQFSGKYRVYDPSLLELREQVRNIIKRKRLPIELHWIPRHQNLADKLLSKQRKR